MVFSRAYLGAVREDLDQISHLRLCLASKLTKQLVRLGPIVHEGEQARQALVQQSSEQA
jgi:hypothetical protein